MDMIQDWATHLLHEFAGHDGTGSTSSQLRSLALTLVSQAWTAYTTLVLPALQHLATTKLDLANIALLLIVVLVSLKILDILWRTLLGWLRMLLNLVFYGGLVALGLWMYARGPDGVAQDVQYWMGVWNDEYRYWKEQELNAKLLHQIPGVKAPKPTQTPARGWF